MSEVVVVRLGDNRFAVDLAAVAEVGRLPVTTRIPAAPGWLIGAANWRGRLLPVVDLRSLFGLDSSVYGGQARLVVIGAGGVSVGAVVDAVEGTSSLAADPDQLPTGMTGPGTDLLAGQVPRADGPIGVLDPAAILRLRDRLARPRKTA